MADVIVTRLSDDELERLVWSFFANARFGGFGLTLGSFSIERRDKPKGRFRGAVVQDRWQASDERRYNSGLERPTSVPDDVIDEAWRKADRRVFIGWCAPEHEITRLSIGADS
jgi:hypothetical protein